MAPQICKRRSRRRKGRRCNLEQVEGGKFEEKITPSSSSSRKIGSPSSSLAPLFAFAAKGGEVLSLSLSPFPFFVALPLPLFFLHSARYNPNSICIYAATGEEGGKYAAAPKRLAILFSLRAKGPKRASETYFTLPHLRLFLDGREGGVAKFGLSCLWGRRRQTRKTKGHTKTVGGDRAPFLNPLALPFVIVFPLLALTTLLPKKVGSGSRKKKQAADTTSSIHLPQGP